MRAKKSKPEPDGTKEYFAKLEEKEKVVDLKESRIGKYLIEGDNEAMNIHLSVFTALERVSERVGNNLPQWCVVYTGRSLDEWYKKTIILPPDDYKRIRKRLKGPLDFWRRRAERDKRMAAAQDVSEVDGHNELFLEQNKEPRKDYDPDIPDPTPWERGDDRPKTTKELEKLLRLAETLEKKNEARIKVHRIKVGEVYYKMRELVQTGKAGEDPETGKLWDWTKWAGIHIPRPERTISGNIKAYLDQLPTHSLKL